MIQEPSAGTTEIQATALNKQTITAYQNDFRRDPILTIDNDRNTFWHSDNMSIGAIKWIAFKFANRENISAIEFIDDYTNAYNMGELKIMVSDDSTNGGDGTWRTIKEIPGDTVFTNGDGEIIFDTTISTIWIKLEMTYQGRGAYEGTPAFYISEINFL